MEEQSKCRRFTGIGSASYVVAGIASASSAVDGPALAVTGAIALGALGLGGLFNALADKKKQKA